jgi:hypothetical protein
MQFEMKRVWIRGCVWGMGLALAVVIAESTEVAALETCPRDTPISVLWNSSWYDATFVDGPNESGECKIFYTGWESSWDEWVGGDRVRAAGPVEPSPLCVVGGEIDVAWQGSWYAATVKETRDDGHCFIGYDGWDSEWDEWVHPDRIRARE